MVDLIDSKLTGRRDRALLAAVIDFNGTPDQLVLDSDIKRQLGLMRTGGRSARRRSTSPKGN